MTDHMTITEHLDHALHAVLAARVTAGRVEIPSLPDDALHGALGSSEPYREARTGVRDALDDLQGSVDEDAWKKVLTLEAATSQALAEAVEVVWKMGWSTGSAAVRER